MSSRNDEVSVPRSGWADRVRTLALGGLGVIPVAGAPVSALVEVLWRPAFERRVEEYLTLLTARLDQQDTSVANLESLLNRDVAISAGIVGASAAGKVFDREKMTYLANAVIAITVDLEWDARADYAMLLLQLVDDLTVTHVRALAWLGSDRWPELLQALQDNQRIFQDLIAEEFPDVDPAAMTGIVGDLIGRNMVINRSTFFGLSTMNPERLSDLGRDFLELIQNQSAPVS